MLAIGDSVLFAERANELILCGLYKELLRMHSESELNSANIVARTRPEAG